MTYRLDPTLERAQLRAALERVRRFSDDPEAVTPDDMDATFTLTEVVMRAVMSRRESSDES